jgi:hypothetical protein
MYSETKKLPEVDVVEQNYQKVEYSVDLEHSIEGVD